MHKSPLGMFAVLVSAIVWGTTGTAATFAHGVSAIEIGAISMGCGGLLQALLASGRIRHSWRILSQQWRYLLLGAAAVAIYPLAFYASMHLAGVTIGTVVSIGSAPLLSALIEYWLDNLTLTWRWLLGAMLGIVGIVLLCAVEGNDHSTAATATTVISGVSLGVLAGFTYALYSWTARRLMQRKVLPSAAMGATFGLGGLLLIIVWCFSGMHILSTWQNSSVGLYMILVPMFIGYLCYGYGLARIPASSATTITLLEPVVAALLAVVIVGERLPFLGWMGVALIIICLVCIVYPAPAAPKVSKEK